MLPTLGLFRGWFAKPPPLGLIKQKVNGMFSILHPGFVVTFYSLTWPINTTKFLY